MPWCSPAGARRCSTRSPRKARRRRARRSRCRPTSPIRPRSRRCSPRPRQTYGRLDLLFNNAGIGTPADFDRGHAVRQMAGRGRHQSHRRVPVHPGSDQDHESARPARRPHHQQRLDLRAHAAAGRRRLYGDQARRHRAHQADLARLPALQHLLRPDRHRQCRDARSPTAWCKATACRSPTAAR